jgi:hypothetical protein
VEFEQVAGIADRVGALIGAQLRRICDGLRRLTQVGLVVGLLLWGALVPWLLELPGAWGAVAIVVLGAVPVWLAWSVRRHVAELEEVYTSTDVLRAELAGLGGSAAQVQARVEALGDAPKRRIGRLRWAFGYLNGLRATWSDLGLTGRVSRLADPVNPVRLARTAWKVAALAATVVVGPPLIVAILLARPLVE